MFHDVAEVVGDLLGEMMECVCAEGDGVVVGGFEFGEKFGDVPDSFRFAGYDVLRPRRVLSGLGSLSGHGSFRAF